MMKMNHVLYCIASIQSAPVQNQQNDWWYDMSSSWETSSSLASTSSFYSWYRQALDKLNMYAYSQHVGKIDRGQFLNPELNMPSDRAFGYKSDFNQEDFTSGVFNSDPRGQRVRATEAMVDMGMARSAGEVFTLPAGQEVQDDESVLIQTSSKQNNPCIPNPCQNPSLPSCSVVDGTTARCSSSCGWKNGKYLNYCPAGSFCSPMVQCPHVTSSIQSTWSPCTLPLNQPGVCCSQYPHLILGTGTGLPFQLPLESTLLSVHDSVNSGRRKKKDVFNNHIQATKHEADFKYMDKMAKKAMKENSCVDFPILDCDEKSRFRSVTGSCNNLLRPRQGSSHTPYRRLLPPSYSDGTMGFRRSVGGGSLPPARMVVDKTVRRTVRDRTGTMSVHAMQWGQFLTHDLDHTPEASLGTGQTLECCGEHRDREECAPIEIAGDDSFYGPFAKTCLPFIRSSLAIGLDCKVDQQNQITSYLDGSAIYGSNITTMLELRLHRDGLLKFQSSDLLPPSTGGECFISQQKCFKSGDKRVNESPGLAIYHTMWYREHNRVATNLALVNPGWGDNDLFYQARKIVVAQIQHITYHEYLPIILGHTNMATMSLLPDTKLSYDSLIDASVSNAFASAALRFGHSMVPNNVGRSSQGCPRHGITIRSLDNLFFNPSLLHNPQHLAESTAGLSDLSSPVPGPSFSTSVMGNLFINRDSRNKVGLDLVSINIQRGRDHGLPGYNSFRALCGGNRAVEFSDFSDQLSSSQILMLSQVYSHVDDVDLYLGGLLEKPMPGSLLGQTFSCIIADQMFRTMVGDRFFYSLNNSASRFSSAQLEKIQKASMARVLCDNMGLQAIQPLAFRTVSSSNPMVDCSSTAIPSFDLEAWKLNKS